MWERLAQQFSLVRDVLWLARVQTREQALGGDYAEPGLDIRYRFGPDDLRDHFLELGRDLLPYIEQCIEEKKFTPQFVHQWGLVMYYHGFIASYMLDMAFTPQHVLGGVAAGQKRSRDEQRKWVSSLIVPLVDAGATRAKAEAGVTAFIKHLLAMGKFPEGFDRDWFGRILTHGSMVSTFDEKHLSIPQMREILNRPAVRIPPITIDHMNLGSGVGLSRD